MVMLMMVVVVMVMVADTVVVVMMVVVQMRMIVIGHVVKQIVPDFHGSVKNHGDSIHDHQDYATLHQASKVLFSPTSGI